MKNREIKFRAWNKENKVMGRVFGERDIFKGPGGPANSPFESYILLQYTGLKDKNGKEIYEGDIIQWWFMGREYDRGRFDKEISFYSVVYDQGSFKLLRHKDKESNMTGHIIGQIDMTLTEFEVVGNIYQNKELLTWKQ